ncbi:DoxX family protein [Photobacterium sp. OFAV2-7]|uniref:DoxX family protein n=1 Tax=Photobacterium sp. OFAV2-7 TaxID=2917748 RepID=UPI001EF65A92|nr:DoxX family protein [Photobacterium sp. OFAV2-7]MCG7588780.1 DoxX family protein [Photobacterium sp. OFAV2-7]
MKNIIQWIVKPNHLMFHDLILRLFVGGTMVYHGQGKLFNLEGTAQFFHSIGIEPPYFMAVIASFGEVFGGLMVMLGLFTRMGALANAASMVVAIIFLGWPNGFDARQGGIEYQATLLVIFIFIAVNGAGRFSVDKTLHKRLQ